MGQCVTLVIVLLAQWHVSSNALSTTYPRLSVVIGKAASSQLNRFPCPDALNILSVPHTRVMMLYAIGDTTAALHRGR